MAAALLNIVTQSTEGSIKKHLSLQFLKMNSNPTSCISCLQEDGKRFLGSNRKIFHNFSKLIHCYRLRKSKLLWHFQQLYGDNSLSLFELIECSSSDVESELITHKILHMPEKQKKLFCSKGKNVKPTNILTRKK